MNQNILTATLDLLASAANNAVACDVWLMLDALEREVQADPAARVRLAARLAGHDDPVKVTSLDYYCQEGVDVTLAGSWLVYHTCPTDEVEQRIRLAVRDYLKTEAGKAELARTHYDYNWGDAVDLPIEFLNTHEIIKIDTLPINDSFAVNHNEVLWDAADVDWYADSLRAKLDLYVTKLVRNDNPDGGALTLAQIGRIKAEADANADDMDIDDLITDLVRAVDVGVIVQLLVESNIGAVDLVIKALTEG